MILTSVICTIRNQCFWVNNYYEWNGGKLVFVAIKMLAILIWAEFLKFSFLSISDTWSWRISVRFYPEDRLLSELRRITHHPSNKELHGKARYMLSMCRIPKALPPQKQRIRNISLLMKWKNRPFSLVYKNYLLSGQNLIYVKSLAGNILNVNFQYFNIFQRILIEFLLLCCLLKVIQNV